MDTLKYILKVALFVSIILSLGQIPISGRPLGGHFLAKVESGSRWAGKQVLTFKWLAGVPVPDLLLHWLNDEEKSPPKKKRSKNDEEGQESISKVDREAMLRLLKE